MLFMVCSVILVTGAWDCGDHTALSMQYAVAMVIASNHAFPWTLRSARSPYTLWPSDEPTPDKRND